MKAPATEKLLVEVRVIEATGGNGPVVVDDSLGTLARDLKSLPFKNYKLKDSHTAGLKDGEQASLEFPGKGAAKRFFVIAARGRDNGKLKFQITIDALKFSTRFSVADGGTIVIAGPKTDGATLVFAVTAKTAQTPAPKPR